MLDKLALVERDRADSSLASNASPAASGFPEVRRWLHLPPPGLHRGEGKCAEIRAALAKNFDRQPAPDAKCASSSAHADVSTVFPGQRGPHRASCRLVVNARAVR